MSNYGIRDDIGQNFELDTRLTSENAERGKTPAPRADQRLRSAWDGLASGPGLDLDISAKLGIGALADAIRDNTNAVANFKAWLASAGQTHPRPRIWGASRITPSSASTYSVLQFQAPADVGGPNGGFRWWIGAHYIQGTDPFTVLASSAAALYVGAIPPNDGTTAPDVEAIDSSIRYGVTTLPWGGQFPPESVGFGVNDTVYYVVKNAGNSQKLTARLIVMEARENQLYFTRNSLQEGL